MGMLDPSEVERLTEAFVVHDKWSRMVKCVKPLVEIGRVVAEVGPQAVLYFVSGSARSSAEPDFQNDSFGASAGDQRRSQSV